MGLGNCRIVAPPLVILSCLCWDFGAAIDTITTSQSIKDPEAIVSAGNKFKLGFFSPANSKNRYVGIWYCNISSTKAVWVANRENPINDSSGMLKISKDGNLIVLNGQKVILWSSNVSSIGVSNTTAQLTDDGNILLQASPNGNIVWQSFQQPSDTYLPGMKLSANAKTGEKTPFASWKSPSDPSIGNFSAGINPFYIPEFFIWNNGHLYWRSGPWVGRLFIGVPGMNPVYLSGISLQPEGDGTFTMSTPSYGKNFIGTMVLSSDGKFSERYWNYGKEDWEGAWEAPNNDCDFYGKCGSFGSCNENSSPICSCLRGFEPKNADEWARENWTSGCIRRTLLQYNRKQNDKDAGKNDGFLKLEMVKVPNFAEYQSSPKSEQDCRDMCLNNYSCVAYSYYNGFGCMSWTGNLIDIHEFSRGGTDLYIRVAYSELDNKRNMKMIITMSVILGAITISGGFFFILSWMAKRRESNCVREVIMLSRKNERHATSLDKHVLVDNLKKVQLQDLPLFNLQKLAAATDNFDISNKIGHGGFGSVFRGKLQDGRGIAVKKLSRSSRQGLEEFLNEVDVISNVQHRNLVRLLGCCVEGEEKMLVYEYMPNKSLDTFLFDPLKKEHLDWKKRLNIIEGICRGLLYLHRDSRLRIVHRDLKASNVLLDQDLNPKIADFGMARIFGDNEDQAKTKRVVGTYGYMSPEYAMEGRFSEKSDVFSFGVLLLETISGRRNTSFYGNEQASSLLVFAWKLWNEGNNAALVDPVISDPRFQEEILRCIHVGLLCVQDFAKDRPSVTTVISMLNSEIVDLPAPKKPAFAERETFQQSQKSDSINSVTVTVLAGR